MHLFLLLIDSKEIKNVEKVGEGVGWVGKCMGVYSGLQEAKESAPSVPLGRAALAVAVWLLLLHAHFNNEFILEKIEWAPENKTETGGHQDVWNNISGQNMTCILKEAGQAALSDLLAKNERTGQLNKRGSLGKGSQNLKKETIIWFVKKMRKIERSKQHERAKSLDLDLEIVLLYTSQIKKHK